LITCAPPQLDNQCGCRPITVSIEALQMLHHPTSPTAAKSKIRPAVMPVGSVTLSDGRGPGERTPTRRYG
jgi:hypothetical protein